MRGGRRGSPRVLLMLLSIEFTAIIGHDIDELDVALASRSYVQTTLELADSTFFLLRFFQVLLVQLLNSSSSLECTIFCPYACLRNY